MQPFSYDKCVTLGKIIGQSNLSILFKKVLEEELLTKGKRVIFDRNDKYVAVVSDIQIIIISLKKKNIGKIVQNYQIDLEAYQCINDIILDSSGCERGDYQCVIACRMNQSTNIHIFDIAKPTEFRSIAFLKKGGDIVVKIADDFNKVLFSNGEEHYMLNG